MKEELKNSPLHGLSAEIMLTELVNFYGWRVLDAEIDLKCFRIQPTIPSALTFLKKAEWARNRVEEFYLYRFKGMPEPSEEELDIKPRERGFPDGVLPKKPEPITVKEAEKARREKTAQEERGRRPEKPKRVVRDVIEEEEEELPKSTFKSSFSKSPFRK